MSTHTDAPSATAEASRGESRATEEATTDARAPDAGDLERIRGLLFGQHIDETQRRFERLEERMDELHNKLDARLDAIEAQLADEAKRRSAALAEEQRERVRVTGAIDDELKQRASAFSKQLKNETSTLREDMAAALTGIAEQLGKPGHTKTPSSR